MTIDTLAVIGITTVVFGIASLLLISRARNRLTEGSIRKYMDNFAICLAFIVIFSVWQTIRSVLNINIDIKGFITYPEYIFLIFAYVSFTIASFRVLKISEEFGFKEDGRKINELVKERQARASASNIAIQKTKAQRQQKAKQNLKALSTGK